MKFFASRSLTDFLIRCFPSQSRLAATYWSGRLRGHCEPELVYLHRIAAGSGIAIDAGANVGLYSYRLSKIYDRVYSFDANGEILKKLIESKNPRIEVMNVGLSSSEGEAVLYLPIVQGNSLDGWASFDPKNCPDAQELVPKKVRLIALDSLALDRVAFIKIDVEGHEVELLKGASQTIERNRPTILIEAKSENLEFVKSFLEQRGYTITNLRDILGIDGQEGNYIFTHNTSAASMVKA